MSSPVRVRFAPALAGLLILVFTTLPAIGAADALLRFEGHERIEEPRHADRRAIEAALKRARVRSQIDRKTAADHLQVLDHQVELKWPMRERVGFDQPSVQAISNFLDQDPAENALEDWNCGGEAARTYDGHNGLDIFLAPFSWYQMEQDTGIVTAAAPGVIRDKVGDQPERSCEANDNGGDNNLLMIEHADGSFGVYAHMRTDSLTAKPVGATVEAGEYLGVVGSSGWSTGPHLHFEVGFFENSAWVPQDPFQGMCNDINATGWWEEQPPYYLPAIMALSIHDQAPTAPPCPQTEEPHFAGAFSAGDTVYFGFTVRDVLRGESVDVELRMPNGNLYTSTAYTANDWDHAASLFVYFSLDLPGNAMAGAWTLRVSFKGDVQDQAFRVDSPPPDPPVLAASNNAFNGLWYDPALDGEGYNIVTAAAGTVIYFYGSDRGGRRLWLVSELITEPFMTGAPTSIVMYESTGGVFAAPVPSRRGLAPWGALDLEFDDCNTGVSRLVGSDGDKTSQLIKLAGVPGSNCVNGAAGPATPYAGLWYDPALEGEGFNLVVTPLGSVLYYYGFDAAGDRLWLVTAPFAFDYLDGDEVTVDLLKATQGTFEAPVPVSNDGSELWGTVTVTGGSCDTMAYVLETPEGDKSMAANRLVSVVGLDC